MLYYDTKVGKRQSAGEIARRGLTSAGLYDLGIVPLSTDLPETYDADLYTVRDSGGQESTASGWRIKWNLIPRSLEGVLDVLRTRLATKKRDVEDSGVTVNGVTVDSAEADRNRVLGLKIAYMDNPDDPALVGQGFKTPSGFVPMTKELVDAIWAAMKARTQAVFAREAEIRALIDAAPDAAEAIRIYAEEIDNGWPEASQEG
ncbi:hypothetical protein JCM15519_04510 [Fundidesulfovibrio butyratiphilus]